MTWLAVFAFVPQFLLLAFFIREAIAHDRTHARGVGWELRALAAEAELARWRAHSGRAAAESGPQVPPC